MPNKRIEKERSSETTRTLIAAVAVQSFFALSGCADINKLDSQLNAVFTDVAAETCDAQQIFDKNKEQIEGMASTGQITWATAAVRVGNLDKALAGRGRWKFDSNDEEYHAYCLLTAQQLDQGKITFAFYDALRTRRFNEIRLRSR